MSKLHFISGVGTVTGACFLLENENLNILFDCGMHQGGKDEFLKNYEQLPFEVVNSDALIISHAHLDHIGRVPILVKSGFKGPIISTPATKDLAKIVLNDAVKVSGIHAEKYGMPKLYDYEDVDKVFENWHTKEYHEPFAIKDLEVEFFDAGHILGSAITVLKKGEKKFAYTGDLGNTPAPLLRDTEIPKGLNYLVIESVYGDRNHEDKPQRIAKLKKAIEYVKKTNGTLLIPSFAIQRAQILIYELNKLIEDGEIESIPVFLDSPMATKVLYVFKNYTHLFNERVQQRIKSGDNIFDFPNFVITADNPVDIYKTPNPKIILSASGMSEGGRVRMHEKRLLSDKKNMILFVGYQAIGTLGRIIQEGNKKVRIDGEWVKVKAKVASISGFSAHKDLDGLVEFVGELSDSLDRCFVVLGEPRSSLFLTQRIREYFEIDAIAPDAKEVIDIDF